MCSGIYHEETVGFCPERKVGSSAGHLLLYCAMSRKRQLVFAMLAPVLLGAVACQKKATAANPKITGPTQAPTLTQTLPYEIQPQQVPPAPQTAQAEEPPKQQQKKRPKTTARKPNVTPPGSSSPQPNAIPAESTTAELHPPPPPVAPATTVAIGPDVSSPEATRDRQSTNQLLDTTENQVKKLEAQNLSSDQHSVLMQIKSYITQSRKAITDGDYERASNLAKKAQLLTEELIKR